MIQQGSAHQVALQWLSGKHGTDVIDLGEGKTVRIGRAHAADITVADRKLSRLHCSITATDQGVVIEDLGSSNGTYVEGKRIKKAYLLPGSEVSIGQSRFKFLYPASGPGVDSPIDIRRRYGADTNMLTDIISRTSHKDSHQRMRKNLHALFRVGNVLSTEGSLKTVCNAIVDSVMQAFMAERTFVLLKDENGGPPRVVASRASAQDASFSQTIAHETCRDGTSILTVDAMTDDRFKKSKSIITQQIRSVMCAPIQTQKKTLGAIYVDSRRERGNFCEEDLQLLAAMGQLAGVAVHRAGLTEGLQRMFLDTVRALIATIDAIDHYTKGHSLRVSSLAVILCQESPRHRHLARLVQLSGLLHDIGKIAVVEVLRKKGPLSPEERELMKTHPAEGVKILRNIHNIKPVARIVLHHHERWDGTGYPDGLVASKIPFGARVLAVADAFDAMTSERPYRPAYSFEHAVEELKANAGTQFDPLVVNAFLRAWAKGTVQANACPISDSVADGPIMKPEEVQVGSEED